MSDRSVRGRLFTTCFSIPGVLAPWFVAWLQIKPNRIVEGTFATIGTLNGFFGVGLSLCWLISAIAAVMSSREVVRSRVMLIVSITSVLVSICACGIVARDIVGDNEITRVSLSWGFWVNLVFAYAAYTLFGQGVLARERRFFGAIVPLFVVACLPLGLLDKTSILMEYQVQQDVFWSEALRHVQLSGYAVLLGGFLGVLAGLAATRHAAFRRIAFTILNGIQTIPSLAFFGLMILPLAALSDAFPQLKDWGIGGIGVAPALIALTLYAIFPVARNTATAFSEVPSAFLDAGRGMGMSPSQLLFRVEFPMALPLVLEGLRTASVQAVGNTVVVAFIGAGGLGSLIFQGLGQFAPDLILLGAIPVLILALAVDSLWAAIAAAFGRLRPQEAAT